MTSRVGKASHPTRNALKKFTLPDGSEYYGETRDGRICGQGAWRSAAGETYVGDWMDDQFHGQGRYTDSDGNTVEGGFEQGVLNGVGTYHYADGRAEVGTYSRGVDTGEGARWSTDRALAWRMRGGEVAGKISLAEAERIASSLGLPVPESIYELDEAGRTRLRESVASLEEDSVPDFDSYLPAPSLDGERIGALIAHSKQPLVDVAVCDAIIAECEARAAKLGGWTTERHENYPTTDVPLQRLPRALAWFRKSLLPEIAFPFLARAFGFALPAVEARTAFRVIDAFVVKYDATAGQRLLKPHRDGSVFSFNVALNDLGQYEGGGTYFQQLEHAGDVNGAEEGSLRSPQGHLLAHSSALMHGGHPITSGVRYILVAFVTVEGTYSDWAYRFYEDVRDRDESKE